MKALMHLALVCPWGVALFDPSVLSDFLRQNQAPQGSDVFEMLRQDPQLRAYALQDGLVLPMYPLEEDVYTFVHLNACPARVDWRFCHGPFPLLIESGRLVAADLFTLAHWDYELFEIVATASSGRLFPGCTREIIPGGAVLTMLLMIITMTAGTGLIMWLGELITERGIGNGMSLLIFTSIVAQFPSNMFSIAGGNGGAAKFLIVVGVVLVATLAVVYIEQAQRRIPVQYAKRMIGRRQYGGSTTYIPVKINTAGVIPVIFASSILAMPQLVAGFGSPTSKWVQWVMTHLQQTHPIYLTAYGILILFFAFFYTAITFDAEEIADNMKRYGGFIPGIRAGEPTVRYLSYVINRITTAGSIYLVVLALIPTLAVIWMDLAQHLPFGGTTILIMVGVGLQTVKEVNSQLQQRHYEGFLS